MRDAGCKKHSLPADAQRCSGYMLSWDIDLLERIRTRMV